ncbi:MAG: hypothetical protein ACFFE2_17005 [Candidatus Thorarchaeota archaeon]
MATSNQNLDWGVEIGDRFYLHYRHEDLYFPDDSSEFDCYIDVESLPAIPDDIDQVIDIFVFTISPELTLYYTNGTEIGPWWALLPNVIIPIGNWTLWSVLLSDYENRTTIYFSESLNITENERTWSWSYYVRFSSNDMTGREGTATFRKSDGVLLHLHMVSVNNLGVVHSEYEITQLSPIDRGIMYVTLAGLGIIILVCLVIVYKKR